jgi:hypothetical protein
MNRDRDGADSIVLQMMVVTEEVKAVPPGHIEALSFGIGGDLTM